MYCQESELKQLIQLAQNGDFRPELVKILYKIADGVCGKFLRHHDEDIRQQFMVNFLRFLSYIDTNQNCFNYLTTMACNDIKQRRRRKLMGSLPCANYLIAGGMRERAIYGRS